MTDPRSHSEVLGVRPSTQEFWEGTRQPMTCSLSSLPPANCSSETASPLTPVAYPQVSHLSLALSPGFQCEANYLLSISTSMSRSLPLTGATWLLYSVSSGTGAVLRGVQTMDRMARMTRWECWPPAPSCVTQGWVLPIPSLLIGTCRLQMKIHH